MAFELKRDWPILALAALALIGLFLYVGSSSNGAASGAASGGISPADAASIEQQQTAASAQLETQAQTNQTQLSSAAEQGIFGLVGSIVQGDEATAASVLSNQTQQQSDTLAAQVAEYQAYEQELGTSFGAATNMTTATTTSANQLQALLAQYNAQKAIAQIQAQQALGISNNGLIGQGIGGLFSALPLVA